MRSEKKKYSRHFPGGTVTKISNKRWEVIAPDGRPVGKFSSFKLAAQKAEHWDKWDVFTSLHSLCALITPNILTLISRAMAGEIIAPSEVEKAAVKDMVLWVVAEELSKLSIEDKNKLLMSLYESSRD